MDKPTIVALVVIGLAVAHAAYVSLFGFGVCSVQATDPRAPRGEETCHVVPSPPALVITALLAIAGAGVGLQVPGLAWAGAGVALGVCVLFGLSVGGALLYHDAVVLAAIAGWRLALRRRSVSRSSPEA